MAELFDLDVQEIAVSEDAAEAGQTQAVTKTATVCCLSDPCCGW